MSYEKIKIEDLKNFHKTLPTSKVMLEYMEKIKDLGEGEAGHFTVQAGEKAGSIKMRLLRAATLLGTPITVKRYGTDVLFWKEEPQVPKAKGRK